MAAIIGAVYTIIMVESMTAGVALYFAIKVPNSLRTFLQAGRRNWEEM